MKDSLRTKLLGLAILLLLISVPVISIAMVHMPDDSGTVADYWKTKKGYFVIPTILNVTSLVILAVLAIMG